MRAPSRNWQAQSLYPGSLEKLLPKISVEKFASSLLKRVTSFPSSPPLSCRLSSRPPFSPRRLHHHWSHPVGTLLESPSKRAPGDLLSFPSSRQVRHHPVSCRISESPTLL